MLKFFSLKRFLLSAGCLAITYGYTLAAFHTYDRSDTGAAVNALFRILIFASCGIGVSSGVLFGKTWVGVAVAGGLLFLGCQAL